MRLRSQYECREARRNRIEKKRRKLERLKDRLADREEEMADLRAELEQTEANYTMESRAILRRIGRD